MIKIGTVIKHRLYGDERFRVLAFRDVDRNWDENYIMCRPIRECATVYGNPRWFMITNCYKVGTIPWWNK